VFAIGLALLPTERCSSDLVSSLTLLEKVAPFEYGLHKSVSIPHMSLMQGVFAETQAALQAIDELDLALVEHSMPVVDLSLWAEKIVFLNVPRSERLQRLHQDVFALWRPLAQGQSADPQIFKSISPGQQASFNATGYPFSQDEYLPHITLGHLLEPVDPVVLPRMNDVMQKNFAALLTFEKLVAFIVEPRGECRRIIGEWNLGPHISEDCLAPL
jgi:hypothetical protein